MSEKEFYSIFAICNNCGKLVMQKTPNGVEMCPADIIIPRGQSTGEFLQSLICPTCGCMGYLKRRI